MAVKTFRSKNAEEIRNLEKYLKETNTKPLRSHEKEKIQRCALLCTYFRQAYWHGNPKFEEKTGRYCFSPEDIKKLEKIYYDYRHVPGMTLLKDKIKIEDDSQCYPILMHNHHLYASFVSAEDSEDDKASTEEEYEPSTDEESSGDEEDELSTEEEPSEDEDDEVSTEEEPSEDEDDEVSTEEDEPCTENEREPSKIINQTSIMTYITDFINIMLIVYITYLFVLSSIYISNHITFEY
jgi:hypothetical protein